ncbi:MAG: M1 family metallopeptidase [Candidatus Marinimicrobia bacterium]|nr:M1 family metallopeptidase [Candidatus Neomarinimicrobiota bacterium]
MSKILKIFNYKILFILFSISLLIGQEPKPIKAGIAPSNYDYQGDLDALHYSIEIGLGEKTDFIEAKVAIKLVSKKDNPNLRLDFTGLKIESFYVNDIVSSYSYDKGIIDKNLNGYNYGDSLIIKVHYSGKADDGLIIGNNVHGNRTIFVDNWPNRTRFWLPSIDHPSDKATVTYNIHAPKKWKVIANGYSLGKPTKTINNAIGPKEDRLTWSWKVNVPIPTYNMVVGAADLEIRTVGLAACGNAPASMRQDGCIEVTYWVYPEDIENAKKSFKRADKIVDYFTNLIGPFPYEKLANVQTSTRFGGMENASAIFYSEKGIAAGRNIEGTVSHEIAHQWFGDAVTEENWHHLWLSEGFATYFGALFFESADGKESFDKKMKSSLNRVINSKVSNRPIIDYEQKDLFKLLNSNNYPKGGWVLHMLRGYLGDKIFFEGIREYYKTYIHKSVLTEQFQRIMEDVSGESLDWFFEQWIFKPGYPRFLYEEDWEIKSGSKETLNIKITQVQKKEWPIFEIPTEICWYNDCREINLEKNVNTFKFDFDKKPLVKGTIDPKGWVLKEIVN